MTNKNEHTVDPAWFKGKSTIKNLDKKLTFLSHICQVKIQIKQTKVTSVLNKIQPTLFTTHKSSSVFRTERLMVSDIEDGHAALSVVSELGSTVLEQQLICVAHYVLCAVLCARQCHLVTVQTALVWRQHAHLRSTIQK